jgi:hypothetical protein
MRPQQQNRRMRGRNNNNNNNNNRKGPNPLTRSYESNGPDVKIRGSAQQIAEKYSTLARDAQSSGDRVMAENYLQHAEHYYRIIAAAQGQMPANTTRDQRDDFDDDNDERGDSERNQQQPNAQQSDGQQHPNTRRSSDDGSGPQPVIEGTPAEVALEQETMGANKKDGNRDGREHRANGSAPAEAGNADGEETAPRRARRPRRPRNRDGEAGESSGNRAEAASVPEASGDEPGQEPGDKEVDISVPAQ